MRSTSFGTGFEPNSRRPDALRKMLIKNRSGGLPGPDGGVSRNLLLTGGQHVSHLHEDGGSSQMHKLILLAQSIQGIS